LAILVLVTAKWVGHFGVGAGIFADVAFVGRAPVIVVTIVVSNTATWGRFVYAAIGRVTAIDGAGITVVAHAIRSTLFAGVIHAKPVEGTFQLGVAT
jgi:hypothetical protein